MFIVGRWKKGRPMLTTHGREVGRVFLWYFLVVKMCHHIIKQFENTAFRIRGGYQSDLFVCVWNIERGKQGAKV